MSASRQHRALRRERRDEPPVCVASLSVRVDATSVPTAESRARDEALLEAIAAEQADAPDRRPSVASRRPGRRSGLDRLLALFGRGLDAWRSAPSETTHAAAESTTVQTQAVQTQAAQTQVAQTQVAQTQAE